MNNVIDRLKKLLQDITNKDFKDVDNNSVLFSVKYGLEPRDLVYLMLFIERDFNTKFTSDQINNFNFFTLNNMACEIMKYKDSK